VQPRDSKPAIALLFKAREDVLVSAAIANLPLPIYDANFEDTLST